MHAFLGPMMKTSRYDKSTCSIHSASHIAHHKLQGAAVHGNAFAETLSQSAECTIGAADNMLQAAYLTIGKLAPDYENVELSVGGSTVAAAVVEATGRSMLDVAGRQLCITLLAGSVDSVTPSLLAVLLSCLIHLHV